MRAKHRFMSAIGGIAVAAVVISAAAPATAANDPEVTREEAIDVFTSVHLALGDAYDETPELQAVYDGAEDADRSVQSAFADEVIEIIEHDDPTFFDRYARTIESGGPIAMEEAVYAGDEKMLDALAVLAPDALEVQPSAICTFGVLACGLTVIIAVNYGAAVNIALGANVYLALWGPNKTWSPFSDDGSSLQRQVVIGAVTDFIERR